MKRLILIPTESEQRRLPQLETRLCGFSPVAAGAMTCRWIQQEQPEEVVLLGIAGGLKDTPVGTAIEFDGVLLDGVGAGDLGPRQLGFPLIAGASPIFDRLPLSASPSRWLLTVCSASHRPEVATARARRYPQAEAEDMEAFAVALACRLSGTPLRVIRGISNRAGDRDTASWRIEDALDAAAELLDPAP